MKYILNASQMKATDQHMINEVGIPSMVLMERAALQTVRIMKEKKVDLTRTLIVCGSGNNGGDGFAVARLLIEEGYEPEIVFVGNLKSRSEETALQMKILTNMGAMIGNSLPDKEYSAIIDSVFGIGLSRAIEGDYLEVIEKMNAYPGTKIAIDIASGVSADDGRILGCAFQADLTVTFAYEKIGQILFPGKAYSGEVIVCPIGIESKQLEQSKEVVVTFEETDLATKIPKRIPDSHKGSYGRVLFITGSRGMSGAAYLSAKAAYLAGAGLVRIYTEESNRMILQQLLPEAIVTTYCAEDQNPYEELPDLLNWADVVCIGCGLGVSECSRTLVMQALEWNTKPGVIDADGLNLFSELSQEEKKKRLLKNTEYIFTPHMKEMSRLWKRDVKELKEQRIESAKAFTEQFPVTLVLKDSRTIVAKEGEQIYLNTSGNAAMAKAGSGDVLSGIISGLLAQKMGTYEAAALGTYLHGLAGDAARKSCGAYSVLAEDILSGFRKVLIDLEEK